MSQLVQTEPVIKTKLLKQNTIQLPGKFVTSLTAQLNSDSLDKCFVQFGLTICSKAHNLKKSSFFLTFIEHHLMLPALISVLNLENNQLILYSGKLNTEFKR